MAVRRDKLLTIKTTEAERSAWQAEATTAGLTLADLIRERMSAAQVGREPRQKRKRLTKDADPALLTLELDGQILRQPGGLLSRA